MKKRFNLTIYQWIFIAIIFAGCMVRILGVGLVPMGLNQDEASAGYEAFALLTTGADRNGITNPVHLLAWGSGQNIAYSWLCIPFVALFGLSVFSVRLPMAIIGCVSVYAFYLLFKELWDKNSAMIATLFFAIYPWHIMKSRWALESNLFPDLVLYGCLFLVYFVKRQKGYYLYLSVLLFSFSMYSYGTSYMFLPFFLGGVWIYMAVARLIKPKQFVLSAALFVITALPIILFVIINVFDLPQMSVLGFTIPKMYVQRFSTVTGTGDNFLLGCIANFKDFITVLLQQGDGLIWNSMKNFGICYIVFVPLIVAGIIISFFKKHSYTFIIHWWTVCALIVVMVSDVNVNRINIIFIPVAYYISVALIYLSQLHRYAKPAVLAVCICLFGLFGINYAFKHQPLLAQNFYYTYSHALDAAENSGCEKIYISTSINQPYMLTLFYTQTPPDVYIDTVEIINPGSAFEFINSFDKYHFYLPQTINPDENAAYIVDRANNEMFSEELFDVTKFQYYCVATSKKAK